MNLSLNFLGQILGRQNPSGFPFSPHHPDFLIHRGGAHYVKLKLIPPMLVLRSTLRGLRHSTAKAPRLTKFALQPPKCVIFGRRHVGIMSAEPVGNYGVKIVFDDLHKTGIFTWDYFYHLGASKFSLMREYIKILRKHNLSREPQRRK
ncbi:uncharacterized protein [Typha latifolia]|uniref:uncharacterized protein isoform X2 n=1 Tax=Typha latifolia TaxID=4733 RepID=UPI003C30D85A